MDQAARERAFFRWVGASYAAATILTALAALVTRDDGLLRAVAITLLVPAGVYFGCLSVARLAALVSRGGDQGLDAAVRCELAGLGRDYRVTRSPCPGADRQDQVTIGPNGVFVVVAADDVRRARVVGARLLPLGRPAWRDLVEDSRIEALRVEERLRRALGRRLSVHSLVCVRRGLVSVGREVRGVRIVTLPSLCRAVADTPAATPLDDVEIQAAVAALEAAARVVPLRPDTRPPRPAPPVLTLARQRRLVGRRGTARLERHS
jgi:hypothetical protein